MAGIGFVLRKLAAKENLSSQAAGFLLSAIVAAGPWLITTVGLLIVSYSSLGFFIRVRDYLLFQSLVTFGFAYSLLFVSILQLPTTRFVSDRFFEMKFTDNRSIYLSSIFLVLLGGAPLSLIVVLLLGLPFFESLAFFDLLMVLIVLWMTTAFVSTLHDYKSVGLAFTVGVGTSVGGTMLGAREAGVAGALMGYLLGEGLIVSILAARLFVEFPGPIVFNRKFISFLASRSHLMVMGLIMTAGIWIDKILFWYGPGNEKVVGYIHVNHLYDLAMFFALLTIIPTLALFVFFFETGFYERYRTFFSLLEGQRPLAEVLEAKERMVSFIKQGLGYILKLQGAITFIAVLNAQEFLSLFHADLLAIPIFRMGALGGFCQVIVTIEITLLLYFNQQKMVARLSLLLLALNAGLTILFWNVGPRMEGFGYFVACLITAMVGYALLDRGVYDFEFSVFMTHPDHGGSGDSPRADKKAAAPPRSKEKRSTTPVVVGLVLGALLCTAQESWAFSGSPGGWQIVPRHCLVLYEGPRDSDDSNNFRSYWELPLNYLGFDAVYRDMKKGFPDLKSVKEYRAIFFEIDQTPLSDTLGFWKFVAGLLDRKMPFVILADFPERSRLDPHFEEAGLLRDRVLGRMGLKVQGVWDVNPFDLSYGHLDRKLEGFEYDLPWTPQAFRPLTSISRQNQVFVGVRSTEPQDEKEESVYGILAPWGGMVLDPFMIRWPSLDSDHTRWYVDPFRFLENILKASQMPRIDLTTLNGQRIFYSQVDGDAFGTLSHYQRRRLSAEVLYRNIFRKIPLPFTVSVITSQIDPNVHGSKSRVYWARRIFSLPNVEAASHTYSHPFYWNPTKKQRDEGPTHIELPHYHLNMKTEINGSIDYINHNLLPSGKSVALLQWSGDTRPGKDALSQLATTGVLNINGSDTRFDNWAPSYTFVAPYFRRVGPYLQFFNSDVNDYILTNNWRGPFFGYLNVIKTFEHTNRPRRVDPIDVYFHFYAGQRESALNALLQVLSWVRFKRIAPLYASQFVKVEEGYIHASVSEKRDGRGVLYKISRFGRDTTVRFDHADTLYPDPKRSNGVIGYRHFEGSLYLYLDPGMNSAIVGLTDLIPVGVWLSRASGYVHLLSRPSRREVDFVYDGWEPSDRVAWRGLSPSVPYRLSEGKTGLANARMVHSGPKGEIVLNALRKGVRYRLIRLSPL